MFNGVCRFDFCINANRICTGLSAAIRLASLLRCRAKKSFLWSLFLLALRALSCVSFPLQSLTRSRKRVITPKPYFLRTELLARGIRKVTRRGSAVAAQLSKSLPHSGRGIAVSAPHSTGAERSLEQPDRLVKRKPKFALRIWAFFLLDGDAPLSSLLF